MPERQYTATVQSSKSAYVFSAKIHLDSNPQCYVVYTHMHARTRACTRTRTHTYNYVCMCVPHGIVDCCPNVYRQKNIVPSS